MDSYEKVINISDNEMLKYSVSPGYIKPIYTISEGFIENVELKKLYSLSQWDDYGLNGWIKNDNEIDKISFEFDRYHPLYIALFHLLNYDDELIIDDDGNKEYGKRFMHIHRNDDKIIMDFIDKVDNNYINWGEKFHVFIKNILPDGRSKIDCAKKDTKERLYLFFNEVHKIFINGCRQISIEEYLINNATDDEFKKVKKIFKRERF